eukprot:5028837-Amphidinium_carterae.5
MSRRGGHKPEQHAVTPGSKRWSAQQRAGWNCPKCTYYNFGFRTTCFGCKVGQRPAGQPLQTQGGCQPQQETIYYGNAMSSSRRSLSTALSAMSELTSPC